MSHFQQTSTISVKINLFAQKCFGSYLKCKNVAYVAVFTQGVFSFVWLIALCLFSPGLGTVRAGVQVFDATEPREGLPS